MVEYDYGQGTAGNAYDADRIDFALGRVYRITSDDATPLVYAEYSYLGDGTIVAEAHPEVASGDGLDLTLALDQFGRVSDVNWTVGQSTPASVDHYSYTYDRNSNRLTRHRTMQTGCAGSVCGCP